MAWPGLFTFGGTEVINASRVEAYCASYGVGWFRPVYNETALAWLIGDPRYTTPLQDDAPWTDPDALDSYDFYGVYPLEITGVEDSTVSAEVVESVIDGGYVQRPRRQTRPVVFSAVLVGGSECAVEYGFRWLKTVLSGAACFNRAYGVCGGVDLCYLACAPTMGSDGEDAQTCYDRVGRSLHDVTTTTGPTITDKLELLDGGAAWSVTWTVVAANPAEFGVERPLVVGFLDPNVDIPYVGGVVPPGGGFDEDGSTESDPLCATVEFRPVYDPTCSLLIPPPDIPTVVPMCFSFPPNFRRRSFAIPREDIPLWTDVVPVISLTTRTDEARSVRIRFYADMFDTGDPEVDPCNFCGDMVFSYLPASSTLTFDGADHAVYIDTPGFGRRRADTLVSDSSGNPFDWPEFSCGFGYVVTVDMPLQQTSLPVIDLSLVPRTA
jgi:hypothetical protein